MGLSTPSIIAYRHVPDDYSNVGGALVAGVASTLGKLWAGKQQKDIVEQQQQLAQQQMLAGLVNQRQTNYMPVVIVGGIFLVGGIAVFFALKK